VPLALATAQTPDSFADEESFWHQWIEKRPVRYIAKPEKLVHIEPTERRWRPTSCLMSWRRVYARGPVKFRLTAQLASPGDATTDPSRPWPESNEIIELGVLTIAKPVSDSADAQRKPLFLPGELTGGM
jgi:catalase